YVQCSWVLYFRETQYTCLLARKNQWCVDNTQYFHISKRITLTDNKRQLFFRRHYPRATISYCGLDPDDHRWSQRNETTGMPMSSL
ncbi:unnamed protein product, partial [Nesidiocoris tenuis]